MRVFYFIPSMNIGGVEMGLKKAFPYLREKLDIQVFYVKSKGVLDVNQRSFFSALIGLFGSNRPNVVISSLWPSLIIGYLFSLTGVPWIIFVHSARFHHKLDAFFHKHFLHRCNIVAVDSKATQRFVENTYKSRKQITHIIPFYFPLAQSPEYLRSKKKARSFIFVGRCHPVKRLDLVCALAKKVLHKWSDSTFNFILVGEPNNEVTQLSVEYPDRIFIKLNLANALVLEELVKSHVYVILSDQEGFSMSTAEAVSSGCFVIYHDVGEIRHYVPVDYSLCVEQRNIQNGSFLNLLGDLDLPSQIPINNNPLIGNYVSSFLSLVDRCTQIS